MNKKKKNLSKEDNEENIIAECSCSESEISVVPIIECPESIFIIYEHSVPVT